MAQDHAMQPQYNGHSYVIAPAAAAHPSRWGIINALQQMIQCTLQPQERPALPDYKSIGCVWCSPGCLMAL